MKNSSALQINEDIKKNWEIVQQKLKELKDWKSIRASNTNPKGEWFGLQFIPRAQTDTTQEASVNGISEEWKSISKDLIETKQNIATYSNRGLVGYCLKQPYVYKILGAGLGNDRPTKEKIKDFFTTFIETWIEDPAKHVKPGYKPNSFEDPSVRSWLVMDIWRFVSVFGEKGQKLGEVKNNVFFPTYKLKLPSIQYELTDEKLTKNISLWVTKLNNSSEIDPDKIVFVSKFLKYRNASEGEKGIQTYKRNRSVPFVPISYLSKKDYETLKKKLAEKLGSGKKNIPASLDFINDRVWQDARNAANRIHRDDSSKSSDDVDVHPDEWE